MASLTVEERYWAKVTKGDSEDDCWGWNGSTNRGYGQLAQGRGKRPFVAHRVSWAIHNGRWPTREEHVLHHCDNPPCSNPRHLHLGTPAVNARERVERGRDDPEGRKPRHGERNGVAKLTYQQVRDIRSRSGPHTSLAREFGVDPALIRRIRLGLIWKEAEAWPV